MKEKGLDWCVYNFSVDYFDRSVNNIIDIHECLMKKTWYKILFGIINEIKTTFINLSPNKCSQEFHYYPFTAKLDKCFGIWNLLMAYLMQYMFQTKQKT